MDTTLAQTIAVCVSTAAAIAAIIIGYLQFRVVKNYTVGIKYVSFICYPTRDSNGEKRTKA